MKNPKLIDEAWIDAEIHELSQTGQVTNLGCIRTKYETLQGIKLRLQPLPTPTKTNLEKIRAGEMAIENDDVDDLRKCVNYCFPRTLGVMGVNKYFFKDIYQMQRSSCSLETTLPTIKASELIKEINSGELATFKKPEWQPKFGEVVEVAMERHETWHERIFLFNHANYYYCVSDNSEKEFQSIGSEIIAYKWHLIRPKQTPTLTLAEAEAKLGVKIVMP